MSEQRILDANPCGGALSGASPQQIDEVFNALSKLDGVTMRKKEGDQITLQTDRPERFIDDLGPILAAAGLD